MPRTRADVAASHPDVARRVPRIALYGHDTMGLGHVRRNLALAGALAGSADQPDVLVVTGAAEAGRFDLPPRTDLLTLPGVAKDLEGHYNGRRLSSGLDAMVGLRRAVLTAGLAAFAPDLLVVDKVAGGFGGELLDVLPVLRAAGTRLVLGLRDVLDAPAVATAEWRAQGTTELLREHYHEVWVYGDPSLGDLAEDCRIPPSVRDMIVHTGFLSRGRHGPVSVSPPPSPPPSATAPPVHPGERYALGLLGGGQDGAELARALATAPRPPDTVLVLVGGPYLPAADRASLHALADADPGLRLVDFSPDVASWSPGASAVVAMGGYNTVTEVLGTDTPALIVPRTRPRLEQLVRARRLSDAGLVDDLHPDRLDAALLGRWLAGAGGRRTPRTGVDLDGLARVPRLAAAHLAVAAHRHSGQDGARVA